MVRLLVALLVASVAPQLLAASGGRAQQAAELEDVVVVLPERVNLERVLDQNEIQPEERYEEVVNGFAAEVSPATREALEAIPGAIVSDDRLVTKIGQEFETERRRRQERQVLPTGVDRIDADLNDAAAIGRDGTSGPLTGVGIAILDTGVDRHRDLDVQPGTACIGRTGTRDRDGHGTHVAGTAAAKDNRKGVVGVAPGAPIYPVKVLNDDGVGSYRSIICGLDWVVANEDKVDVVNMSLGARDPQSTTCDSDALHRAVCNVVEAGIPVVVAAGNEERSAETLAPAKFDEVITVSAFADANGRSGGGGSRTCANNRDDSFSRTYSNYGPAVDIAAPGDCIRSTYPGDRYRVFSGSSMASPHVAGAVALFLSENPDASPADVREWLLTEASVPQSDPRGFGGDVDSDPEPALYLGG